MIQATDALALALFGYPFLAFALERRGAIAAVPRSHRTGLSGLVTGRGTAAADAGPVESEQGVPDTAD